MSGTKKAHKHKDFRQNPPPLRTPTQGPLTPQILHVWGLVSFSAEKGLAYRILRRGSWEPEILYAESRRMFLFAPDNGAGDP